MRCSLSRALLASALSVLLASGPARADDDDVEKARRDFAEGVKRYRDGDYEGARVLFQQADAAHHAPAIVYNIARTEERLGHPQAAVDAYDAYLASEGEKGEFTEAAILAIARIRASARQIHVETEPSGARVFVDGAATRDRAPTRVLVPAGRHHVVAEGDDWRAETDVDTGSASVDVKLASPSRVAPPASAGVRAPPSLDPSAPPPAPPAPPPRTAEGFVIGGQIALVPHRFDATADHHLSSTGLAAGPMIEAGYAPSETFAILARGLFAVGSKGVPATTLTSVGVALSFHVTRALWIGGAFQGGRALLPGAITPTSPSEQLRFDSDWVFCPTLEVSLAVLTRPYGQWLVSFFPGYYFASPADNDVLFAPIGFGLRTF